MPKAPFGERITIQNKCYEVSSLYIWIITQNNKILPSTRTAITVEEKQRLIQAYEALSRIPNILTRDKLIEIYPNLLQVTIIDLSWKGYTDIALGTFTEGTFGNNLPVLTFLSLQNNKIRELQPGIFNNLPNLKELYLCFNHRRCLWQIQELQPSIFDNLPRLNYLYLNKNKIRELQHGTFNNLLHLSFLRLNNNQIRELQPQRYLRHVHLIIYHV